MSFLVKNAVWEKAARDYLGGSNPTLWRIDQKGRYMYWHAYGDRNQSTDGKSDT